MTRQKQRIYNPKSRIKVFLVEDDRSMSHLIQGWLGQLGYKLVGKAESGETALKKISGISPDLIIMDIFLTGNLDGIKTAEKINEFLNVPIIFLTGNEDETLFHRAKITNPKGYVLKPITKNELNIAIKFALFRKKQEQEIKAARDYNQNIINSSLDFIITVDNRRKIIEFNRAAEHAFGYSKTEVLGKHINILYAQKRKGLIIHKTTLKNGRCVEVINNIRKDGTEFPCLLAASVIRDLKGRQVGVMGVSRDISERVRDEALLKESEKKFRNLSEQLTEMNDFRVLLIDVISHDLKNPAGNIKGFSEILLKEMPGNEVAQEVNNASKALLKIVDNVTALSKMTLGENIDICKINLADLIRETAREYTAQFKSKNMDLEVDLPETLWVKANLILVEIIRNYLSNALKYATTGKKVKIKSEYKGNLIIIKVEDFGRTIPKSKREIIFNRGVQLKGDEIKKGRGLGLAIVKRIGNAHGASVGVKPLRPQGNVFYLSIPRFN